MSIEARGTQFLTLTIVVNVFLLFQNNVLPSGDKVIEGDKLVIQDVTRHHSGIYLCTGDNKVGRPDTAQIDLKVLCKPIFDFKIQFEFFTCLWIFSFSVSDPPEIEVTHTWVRQSEGIEAEVSCNVHAEPKPEVKCSTFH